MMPTIPSLTLDLGSEAIRLGWTMDGTAIILLAVLLIPWLVLGLSAIVDVLGIAPRRGTIGLPEATTIETMGADTAMVAGAELRRAA